MRNWIYEISNCEHSLYSARSVNFLALFVWLSNWFYNQYWARPVGQCRWHARTSGKVSVAEKCDCRRKRRDNGEIHRLSHFSATVSFFWDSLTFLRQIVALSCDSVHGQALRGLLLRGRDGERKGEEWEKGGRKRDGRWEKGEMKWKEKQSSPPLQSYFYH